MAKEYYLVSHLVASKDYYADPDYCKLFELSDFEGMKKYLEERNAIYNKAFQDTGEGKFNLDRNLAESKGQDIYVPIHISVESPSKKTPVLKVQTANEVITDALSLKEPWEKQTEWEIMPDGTMIHRANFGNGYTIDSETLGEEDWIYHIAEKGWDMNTFIPAYFEACRRVGLKVFPQRVSYK